MFRWAKNMLGAVKDLIEQGKASTSDYLKQVWNRSAAPTPFIRSRPSKANTRYGGENLNRN